MLRYKKYCLHMHKRMYMEHNVASAVMTNIRDISIHQTETVIRSIVNRAQTTNPQRNIRHFWKTWTLKTCTHSPSLTHCVPYNGGQVVSNG